MREVNTVMDIEKHLPAPKEFGRLLREKELSTVLVIDDLLDPPLWSALLDDNRNSFISDIERDEKLYKWLEEKDLLPPRSIASQKAETYLENIEALLNENQALELIWNEHVLTSFEGKSVVQELVSNLEALGLNVISVGVQGKLEIPKSMSVIFLDFTLEERDRNAPINVLNSIYARLDSDSVRPMVVLMSQNNLTAEEEYWVRDETKTMPGMFCSYHKSLLKGINLHLLLKTLAGTLANAQSLQLFSNAVADATVDAANKVAALVKEVRLEDYALIQLLSLHSDGHPLGDYVLWLLATYFAQHLSQNKKVQASQEQIDRMVFDIPPVTSWGPSEAFSRAYKAAIFAPVTKDFKGSNFPALTSEAENNSGDSSKIVVLHFGDVFVEGTTKRAYMIASPECDLAFGGGRAFPKNRSVVLIPGKLVHANTPFQKGTENHLRTEMFEWNDQNWRIEWRLKEVLTVPLGEFRQWTEDKSTPREHVKQIRFQFASEIQRAYAADLTRVGVPVIPPLVQSFEATIFVRNVRKKAEKICEPISTGALLFTTSRYCKLMFQDKLYQTFLAKLPVAIQLAQKMPSNSELERIQTDKRAAVLEKCQSQAQKNVEELMSIDFSMSTLDLMRNPHEYENLNKPLKIFSWLMITTQRPSQCEDGEPILTIYLEAEEQS